MRNGTGSHNGRLLPEKNSALLQTIVKTGMAATPRPIQEARVLSRRRGANTTSTASHTKPAISCGNQGSEALEEALIDSYISDIEAAVNGDQRPEPVSPSRSFQIPTQTMITRTRRAHAERCHIRDQSHTAHAKLALRGHGEGQAVCGIWPSKIIEEVTQWKAISSARPWPGTIT